MNRSEVPHGRWLTSRVGLAARRARNGRWIVAILRRIEREAPELVATHQQLINEAIGRAAGQNGRLTAKQVRWMQNELTIMGAFFYDALKPPDLSASDAERIAVGSN